MERDFTDVIRNKSRFDENASRKISDTRQHEGYVTDVNVTTSNALVEGRTIKEKLKDNKYDTSSSATTQTDDYEGSFKTETEIHQNQNSEAISTKALDAAGKEELVSSNLFNDPAKAVNPTARAQSYMALLNSKRKMVVGQPHSGQEQKTTRIEDSSGQIKYSGQDNLSGHGHKTTRDEYSPRQGKYQAETVYDAATGRYVPRPNIENRSYTFKGNQVQGAAEDPTNKCVGIYSTYVNERNASLKEKNGLGQGAAIKLVTGVKKPATKGNVKDSGVVKNSLVVKAKGSAEAKSNLSSKTKGSTKETFSKKFAGENRIGKKAYEKKLAGGNKTSGKYKAGISSSTKTRNQHKIQQEIKNAVTSSAIYEISHDEENQNSGVEAARGTAKAGYVTYSKLRSSKGIYSYSNETAPKANDIYSKLSRKANNSNSRKYAMRSGKSGEKAQTGNGKYNSRASKSVTRSEADKRARQLREQRKNSSKMHNARMQDARIQNSRTHFSRMQPTGKLSNWKKEELIENSIQTIKQAVVKAAKKTAEVIARNWKILLIAGTALVLFIAVSAGISSCAMAFTGGTGEYIGGLAGSEDFDMTEADSYFTEKEMLLQEEIDSIEEDYPDFDEYIYDIAEISHDALKLMAFLSAEFETYDLDKVKEMLDSIFDEMYELELEPKTEIRTRMVTITEYDETTDTYYEYEVEEEYEWKMLYVTLKKNEWDPIIEPKFTDEKNREMYEIYDDTDGAHQSFYNPFDQDWSSHVTSEFGWRIHPIFGKEKFHNGIDIGLPTGTPIHSCSTGTVIQSYFSQSAGNYIIIEDETGYTTHYMHLSVRNVAAGDIVKHGDIIGQVGSTGNSTGPHLHLGVKSADGEWLNPRFMVSSFVKGE